ncbi:MAG: signal peptide peptidase SppA [Bacteroidales bacterium]|nr:signal peptide peptidase SppA [Bacteroidales bacterium]MDD4703177.1 signal peptide peptidase SppA [Bacteroidales bacterium]MDX9797824.1 signal peptide peptidase SppA [Bacteroidales bacterium]
MKQFFKFMFASCLGVFLSTILIIVLLFVIGTSIIASSTKSVPTINDNSVLVIKLDKPIYDREVSDFSSLLMADKDDIDISSSIGLTEFIAVVNKAKADPKIKAIMLDLSLIQANGWATVQEMRDALVGFKESKKKIYAFSDSYTQNAYYLATVADEIALNPVGHVQLTGLGGQVMFVKDLLNKFDIDVELLRPANNDFKSAGEMFVNNKMSEASRTQIKAYISSIWGYISNNISESRKIDISTLNKNVSNLETFMAEDALKNKYVDNLTFRTDIQEKIKKDLKLKKVNWVQYRKYRSSIVDIMPKGKDQIAVIYAYGDVGQGKSGDLSIGSETIVRELRRAVENSRIKAIVLRINSGGGDAIASEQMTNEVIKANKIKPVIVSMGDVAASAGYEMACGAQKIVANPITITGSIGVFGVIPNFGKALKNKIGIGFDTVQTHKNSVFISGVAPMSTDTRAIMQKSIDVFYNNFVDRVATGRNKSFQYIDSIAKGRVWVGMDAKNLGLVDEFGGLYKSIEIAAKEAKIQDYGVVTLPKTKDIAEQIFSAMGQEVELKLFTKELGKPYSFFLELKSISDMKGVQARIPYIISY